MLNDELTCEELDAIQARLWYAPLPGGGTAIPGRASFANAVDEAVSKAQRRKSWWRIISRFEEVYGEGCMAARFLRDEASTAGIEPWEGRNDDSLFA